MIDIILILTTSPLIRSIVTVEDAIAHLGLVDALPAHPAVEVLLRAVVAVELVTEVGTVHDTVTYSPLLARLLQPLHTS